MAHLSGLLARGQAIGGGGARVSTGGKLQPSFSRALLDLWGCFWPDKEICGARLTTCAKTAADVVISGDAVYNNTHPYLAECDDKARGEWLRALDTIEALLPQAVVAGHGVLDPDSSPGHIGETRRYLHDFNASVASTSTAMELYERMLTLHPKSR